MATVVVLACYSAWRYANPQYVFSQNQYDEGYYMAFRANSTGPAHMDFNEKLWSMGKGFDDGKRDFTLIYKHPNVGPFSYEPVDRLRDVIDHIQSSTTLDPLRKKIIVEQLKADLGQWEKPENGK